MSQCTECYVSTLSGVRCRWCGSWLPPEPLPPARIVGQSRLRGLWRGGVFVLGMIGAALLTGFLFMALMAVALFACILFFVVMT